jgi:DNA-binding YbaB/EbfC family protein
MSMDMNQNLGNLMKEAQKMQQRMQEAQAQLKKLRVYGKAGGNKVVVEMAGDHVVEKVSIAPSLLDDVEMLEDLVAAAFNHAVQEVEKKSKEKITELTSQLKIPADFMKEDDGKGQE